MRSATADAPCTVGNFGPGFDVFSLALARRGDRITLSESGEDRVSVTGVAAARIPTDWSENSACAAISALRHVTGKAEPLHVAIDKGMPAGSGLGSSASSNAAAVRAFARYHALTLDTRTALDAAAYGESVATGAAHHDDVAAALFGGLVIVGGKAQDTVVRLTPPPLSLVVARPDVELPTREMRRLIPDALPKAQVVANLSNVARIVHACHERDAAMLCRALEDSISRPYRAPRVPAWDAIRGAALTAGATGFLLSGSGPAMIAAMPADVPAEPVARAMREAMSVAGLTGDVFETQPAAEVNGDEIRLH